MLSPSLRSHAALSSRISQMESLLLSFEWIDKADVAARVEALQYYMLEARGGQEGGRTPT